MARTALQRTLAARWQAGSRTSHQRPKLAARLGNENDGEDIRQLFALADEANYSGHEPTTIDFTRWTQVVRRGVLGEHAMHDHPHATDRVHHRPDRWWGARPKRRSAQAGYSAADLYNAANAYARAGKPGMAVLHYERARLLAPNDPDIEANLRLVREPLRLPSESRNALARAVTLASPTTIAWIGVMVC